MTIPWSTFLNERRQNKAENEQPDIMKTRSQIQGRNKSQIHRQQRLQQSHTCRLESISASIPLQPHPNKPTAVQSDGAPVSILQPRPSNSKPFLAGQDPAKAAKEKGGTVQGKDVPVEVQTQKALDPEDREKIVANMYAEFKARRKLLLTGLPHDCCWEALNDFLARYSCTAVSSVKDGSVRVLFPDAEQAKTGLALLSSAKFEGHKLSASYGHPDSLLFVGNLPYPYTSKGLSKLFQPHGDILRCFVVSSTHTGLSKGYGFVEFARREEALQAKQQLATKVLGLRSLRVDFADNGMQTCEDLQSKTLFVDRLPKGFKDDAVLRGFFCEYGTVNFCQVALAPSSGCSRGFAFVDMSSSEEAEEAQGSCNGSSFAGQEIRVSFGMPCRPGACILQHRSAALGLPFNPSTTVNIPTFTSIKENLPFLQQPAHPSNSIFSEAVIFPPRLPPTTNSSLKSLSASSLLQFTHPKVHAEMGTSTVAKSESLPQLPFLGVSGASAPVSPHPPSLPQSSSLSRLSQSSDTISTGTRRNKPLPSIDDKIEEVSNQRKRPCPEPDWLVEDATGAYDKPYIGQHQQGIPYTHPLKRIKMEKSN